MSGRKILSRAINPFRRGFTLIELLVVISILGMLMALLLPAIGSVRERGRRLVCATHIDQVAKALATYHSQNNCYPPGVGSCTTATASPKQFDLTPACQGPNWLAKLLPQIDEEAYFNQMMACIDINYNPCKDCAADDTQNPPRWVQVGTRTPPTFLCPSAETIDTSNYFSGSGLGTTNKLAKGNIAANFGADYAVGHKGMFDIVTLDKTFASVDVGAKGKWKAGGHGIRIDDVHDGAAQTVMLSEVLGRNNTADIRGAWFLPNMGASAFTGMLPPNATAVASPPTSFPVQTLGTTYKTGMPYYDVIQGCDTQQNIKISKLYCGTSATPAAADSATPGSFYAAARSAHPGGVNVAMAGNNVLFVNDNVDADVWMACCTRDGKSTGNAIEIKAQVAE